MAEKRMFTQKIIDSDAFLEMPLSAQALYFHLNMRADDDGFVNNPKKITAYVNASLDDLKLLLAKRFLIGFDTGVIVIKHWRMHNTLRADRYKPTDYQEEYAALEVKENKAYTERAIPSSSSDPSGCQVVANLEPSGCQVVAKVEPQNRLDKSRLEENRLDKDRDILFLNNNARESDSDEDDGFETFWAAYPARTGDIRQAYFEYLGALQAGATAKQIMDAVEWQKQAKDTKYMPSAEKWLRNKGWTEEKPKEMEPKFQPVDMDYLNSIYDRL